MKSEIIKWFDDNKIANYLYSINDDSSVKINNSISLKNKKITEIPFKINRVNGDFNISDNLITSLKNFPDEIDGDFHVKNNPLGSLEFFPKCNNMLSTLIKNYPHLSWLPIVTKIDESAINELRMSFLSKIWQVQWGDIELAEQWDLIKIVIIYVEALKSTENEFEQKIFTIFPLELLTKLMNKKLIRPNNDTFRKMVLSFFQDKKLLK